MVGQGSNTEDVTSTVYVRLLGEGTEVFRPVPALSLSSCRYVLKGQELFDPADEQWEFVPGTTVRVERRPLSGNLVLVAVEKA